MNTEPTNPGASADLRQRAEAQVRAHAPTQLDSLPPEQSRQLTYELRVHQVELEIQNEELRRAQAALEASQARYFDLYDLAPVGYLTLSANGLIQEVNLHAANLLGVTRTQLVQRPLGSLVCKEDQDDYYRYRQQLDKPLASTAASAALICELRMKRTGGDLLWVRLDAARAQDANGAPVFRVTLSDITERKQLEDVQAFLAQHEGAVVGESFFEALASYLARILAMDFVCIDRLEGDGLTAQTVAVWCDGKFEDNTAYALKDTPCGDVVGQAVCCFPASVCQHFPRDTVLKDLRAESYLGVTLWSHTGQPIGLIAVIGRKPLAHRPLAETILKAVTVRAGAELERLATENDLRKSEEKYRSLFDESVAAIYHFDEKKHFIDSNQAGLELLGYTREGLLRLSMADVDADPPAVLPAQQQVLAGGQVTLFEHKLLRKDGRVITVLNNSRPLTNAQGQVVGLQSTLLDITERKRVEEQLREKEGNYHTLADSGMALIWTSGTDTKCDYFNQPWLQFTGRTLAQELGDGWAEGVHPEDLARCFKIYAEAFDRQESFSVDYRLRRHDGEFRWIQDEGTPRHDSRGHFLGYIGHCLDITERKRAELIKEARLGLFQLAETYALNEFLQHLLDQLEALTGSRVGFYHFVEADQNTLTLQAWSTRTAQELCKAAGQGRHYAVAAAGVWVDCIRARRPVVHNDYASLTHRKGLPPGHAPIIRELVVPVLRGDRIVAVLGVGNKPTPYGDDDVQLVAELADLAWDLVARKQAEEQLRQSETRLRVITNSAQDAILMMDPEGRISFWNPAAEHIFGYTSAEALGQNLHALIVPLRYHAAHQAAFPAFQQTGQGAALGELLDLEARRKDGRELSVQLSLSAVELEGRWHAVGLVRDITERKRVETELRLHGEILESMAEGVVLVNPASGGIIYTNPTFEHMFGYAPGELIGRPISTLNAATEGDPEETARRIQLSLKGSGFWRGEVQNQRKDGSTFWCRAHVSTFEHAQHGTVWVALHEDITAHKRAEAALQKTHTTLLEAQKIAHLGSFEYVAATRTTVWSEEEYRIYGLGPTGPSPAYDELLARHVHPDDAALLHESFTKALQICSVYEFEHRIVRPDGSERWVHDLAYPYFDGQGELLRYVGTTMDITERKQAEMALRESEERHRVVTNTMLHGLVHQRGDGTIISMNPAAERILGRTMAEFIGSSSVQEEHHTLHEDGSPFPGLEHPAMVALRTGQSICSVVMGVWNPQRKEHRWIEVDAVPVFAPGQASPTEVYTVFADITARKQAEAALHLQGAALAAAANAIVITDAQGTIEWANPAFSVLSGYTLAETLGKNPRDLVKSGQQTAAFYAELRTTIQAGQVWHGELVNRRKDGTLYTEDMTITPLRGASGAVTHFIAIKQNISERKELEKQLLRSQRLESVGRLAGGIAHDLNNILSPVMLALPLLRAALRDPNMLSLVDLVETSTKRGAGIIKQLLTFSRGLKGERVPLQLSLLVREMRSIMRETFPKNITIQLQLPTEVPLVLGDTTQLHQVLMNLCVNARDALPDGGELTLSLETLTLDTAAAAAIPGARAGSFVVLGVGDNGTGIAPEIQEKIYDPFFTTKAVGKGSGLGLSTTLGIVRSHAGFIQVRSAPGQGTLFRVFLPVSIESLLVDSAIAAEVPTAPQGHGEQVLVVDDEAHLRFLARKILEGNGYRVLLAEDGAEALRLLESGNGLPQVVLTDLLMPRMDGLTLIHALRQLPVPPKIAVMGGIPPPPETLQELGLTAQAFIAKPFDAATLLETLHRVLS